MINFYRLCIFPVLILQLISCNSAPEIEEKIKKTETVVTGMNLPERSQMTVRDTEIIKIYHTGRYVDPANPNIMHESGHIYVVKRSPSWNTRPNTPVFSPDFSDRLHVRGNKQISIQQRTMMQQQKMLRKSNATLSRLVSELKASRIKLKQLRQSEKDNSKLQPEIKRLKQEQSKIIEKLAKMEQ